MSGLEGFRSRIDRNSGDFTCDLVNSACPRGPGGPKMTPKGRRSRFGRRHLRTHDATGTSHRSRYTQCYAFVRTHG